MDKLCECGCGRETNIILVNNKTKGLVKGEYRRFIKGHNKSLLGKHWKIKDTSKMKGHKIWCEGQRSGINKICEICGKKFYVFPSTIHKKYCSNKCFVKSRIGKENKWGKHTPQAIKKIKEARNKQLMPPRSPETIKKMKIGITKAWKNPKMRESARHRRMKQILPIKDTTIEIKIQDFLTLLHIEFLTHQYMHIEHGYQCDVFIPEQEGILQKTIIEADGCYWHNCQICNLKNAKINKNDNIRTKELQKKGFRVIRLWEHEIRKMEVNDLGDKIYGI